MAYDPNGVFNRRIYPEYQSAPMTGKHLAGALAGVFMAVASVAGGVGYSIQKANANSVSSLPNERPVVLALHSPR